MTAEEARTLRVGDVVLVRAIVQADFSKARYVPMATDDEAPCNFNVYPDAIHSVLPRPLEVGDRVKHDEFGEGVLRYVEGDEAVMRVDPTPTFEGLFCVTLSELERVSQ